MSSRKNDNRREKFSIKVFISATFLFLYLFVSHAQEAQSQEPWVRIIRNHLWVDFEGKGHYKPFFVKSVCYSPMPIGRHPKDCGWLKGDHRVNNIFDDPEILDRDFKLINQMHANSIRIWKGDDTFDVKTGRFPNKLTKRTLDFAERYGLKVIAGFWVDQFLYDTQGNILSTQRQSIIDRFVAYVNSFKRNKAILFWAIGNENNYGHHSQQQLKAWYVLANDLAKAAHLAEGKMSHPVALINGEVLNIGNSEYATTDDQLSDIDIWGIIAYRGGSFDTLFSDYLIKSQKPLWMAEFGVDSWREYDPYHPERGYEDQKTQSIWLGTLWDELVQNSSINIGGSVMEYSDEWWKAHQWYDQKWCADDPSCLNIQNHQGHPHVANPDHRGHEEWFGIMSISPNRANPLGVDILKPREGYFTLQSKWEIDPWPDLNLIQLFPEPPANGEYNGTDFKAPSCSLIYFTAVCENYGNSLSGANKIDFYVDDELISEDSIDPLPVGGVQRITSSEAWVATPGVHQIKAVVNSDGQIVESNASHNVALNKIRVIAGDQKKFCPLYECVMR